MRITGCPIRADLATLPPREESLKRLNLDSHGLNLVVTGASQGAKTVNEAVLEAFKSTKLQGWHIIHLTGKDHADAVRQEYRDLCIAAGMNDYVSKPIRPPELAEALARTPSLGHMGACRWTTRPSSRAR